MKQFIYIMYSRLALSGNQGKGNCAVSWHNLTVKYHITFEDIP